MIQAGCEPANNSGAVLSKAILGMVEVLGTLHVALAGQPEQRVELDRPRIVIGRHPSCEIVLGYSAVSGRHAQIALVDGEYYVEDLNSRNGTYLNGQRLQGPRRLRNHDRLDICDIALTFHRQSADSPPKLVLVDEANSSIITSTIDLSSSELRLLSAGNPEDKLHAMIGIVDNLGSTLAVRDVLPKILDSLLAIFAQADHGFVVLRDSETGPAVPRAAKRRGDSEPEAIRTSLTTIERAMETRQAILSEDAAKDQRFESSGSVADLQIRSMMCAPLINSQGRALGAIQLETRGASSQFRNDDLDLLASIARLTAFAVENAQLHEALLEQQATERDLALAREVQRSFLPAGRPRLKGYEFFDFYEPARQVGGDYFDYIRLPGERLAVVVADVSGKGVPAALLMARLCTEARYSLVSQRRPAAAISRLNASFMARGREDYIVTLVLLVLDLRGHSVTVVSAGHMAPLLSRDGQPAQPIGEDVRSLPIGVDPQLKYQQFTMRLSPGESLTLFTDGLSEARSTDNEFYGLARLREQLGRRAGSAAELSRRVLADVKTFMGKRRPADDMCLVCVRRT